jgi:anti-sigma factor ChrR (cupin superfamily)
MNALIDLKPPAVEGAGEANVVTCHPADRALGRYACNEMGARRKKVVVRHLEGCEQCRKAVARIHTLTRTFRDWEKSAIMYMTQGQRAQLEMSRN